MKDEAIVLKKDVGGWSRLYMRPKSPSKKLEIPTPKEIKEQMDNEEVAESYFVQYFPGNAEGLIWGIRQRMNKDNYHSFIYLLARYAKKYYNPSDSTSWQFLHNVVKVNNKLNNTGITVKEAEKLALNYMMKEMPNQSKGSRIMFLTSIVKDLERQYGIFVEED